VRFYGDFKRVDEAVDAVEKVLAARIEDGGSGGSNRVAGEGRDAGIEGVVPTTAEEMQVLSSCCGRAAWRTCEV